MHGYFTSLSVLDRLPAKPGQFWLLAAGAFKEADVEKSMAANDSKQNLMLPLIQDFRAARDALGARPSTERLEESLKDIEKVNSQLSLDLEDLSQQRAPLGVDHAVFRALLQVKRDVFETKAAIAKAKAQSVVDLNEKFKHYDKIVSLAERVSVGDAKPSQLLEAASSGGLQAANGTKYTTPSSSSLHEISEVHEEPQPKEAQPVKAATYSSFLPLGKVSDSTFGDIVKDTDSLRLDGPTASAKSSGTQRKSLLSNAMASAGTLAGYGR